MEIRTFNKQALYRFINSREYHDLEYVPITPYRAMSHIRNPRADDDDVLLLVAFEDDVHLGYLGVFADYIHFGDKCYKAGWLSCLWISPKSRGKGIAKKLLDKAFECWDYKILVTEFTPEAKQLYDKTGQFLDLKQVQGIRLYFRFNLHKLLPAKAPVYQKLKPALKAFDSLSNLAGDLRFPLLNYLPKDVKLEYVNNIDEEAASFIQHDERKQFEFTRRTPEDLEWMIRNPWVLSAPIKDNFAERYHFTAVVRHFEFFTLKIRNLKGDLIAFLIMAKKHDHLKLPYLYYTGNTLDTVVKVLLYHCNVWRINMFTTFHSSLVEALWEAKTSAIYKKIQQREYIISKVFEEELQGCQTLHFQDGDADNAFT